MCTNDSIPTILLTGVNGQLGYALARSLQGLGNVLALDRGALDLAQPQQIRQVVRAVKPQLIINPAAYTAVDKAESELNVAMSINAEGPSVLADEARKIGAPLIHFSTDYVFDGTKPTPYEEDDETGPINAYGRSKLAGESAIAASGCAHVILRTSWVYGLRGKTFLTTMLSLAQKGAPLRIVDDQIGAPTWAVMLAAMTAHIVAQGIERDGNSLDSWYARSGIYHLTGSGATSWAGFAQAIFAALDERKRVTIDPIRARDYPTPAKRPANSRLSNGKLQRIFGLRSPSWEDSLSLCLAEAAQLAAFLPLFSAA